MPSDTSQTGTPPRAERVDVCICTFRRESVVETLRSVAEQRLPQGVSLRAVVVDNDEVPEARERIAAAQAALGVEVAYVHAPARNISIARNGALAAADGDWIAFLDDDETASPHWLAALLSEARSGGWDAVLGPVDAVYGERAPAWMRALDFHSTRPVVVEGKILKGYAGNVLLRRAAVEARALRFDLARGRTGGEDDDFFYRLTDAGGRIGYAPDAVAYEPVPDSRAGLGWLLKRSFRTGQTHGARLRARHGGAARLVQLALAAAKAGVCALGAFASAPAAALRNRWLVRLSMHAGVVARLAGGREIELY